MSQPLPGIACRINVLSVRVAQESALSAVVTRLQKQLEQAGTRVEDARETCLIGKTAGAKRKLGKVSKALALFAKTLKSKKAKTAPQALRDEITGIATEIRSDVGLVRIGLSCP